MKEMNGALYGNRKLFRPATVVCERLESHLVQNDVGMVDFISRRWRFAGYWWFSYADGLRVSSR